MKILVADDSRVMRQIVIRTLRQAGYAGHEIVEAENGREALETVHSEAPDLVLSDWNMPEMNGIDLLERCGAAGSTVPFGFVTSEGSDEMRARAAAGRRRSSSSPSRSPRRPSTRPSSGVLTGLSAVNVTAAVTYLPTTKEIRDLLTDAPRSRGSPLSDRTAGPERRPTRARVASTSTTASQSAP